MRAPAGPAIPPAGKRPPFAGSAPGAWPRAPDLAPLHEQGVSGFDYFAWFAAWGPAGMPAEIVTRYSSALHEIFGEPEMREALAKQGASIRLSSPRELDRLNRADFAALAKLGKDAKIKGD